MRGFLFMSQIADIYSMCGIAGIISVNREMVSKDRLSKMTGAIAHRGPDGEKHWINETGTTGLGHRRLSIIDLSENAAQPMHCLHRYTIVHNGEIYNYIELRTELTGKGYSFNSLSDTEVLVAAYDYWKENCLQHFDGMFAFAIWDEKEQNLFAARDRFGEKPFYYYYDGQQLVFASEIKALWAAGIEKQPNEKLLFNFITLGYTQNPGNASETAYNGIYKLPAASFFTHPVQSGSHIQPVTYWQIKKARVDDSINEETAVGRFKELFTQSIKNRLRSDVPLGTSLSGGLDSSSILAFINKGEDLHNAFKTFSATFPGFKNDESAYIKTLGTAISFENYQVQPSAEGLTNDIERILYQHEGLIGSASVYAQYKVFELAKQHNVKVLLDGQGADEILAGYHKYYHWYWQELYRNDKSLLYNEISAARSLGVKDEWGWKNKLAAMYPVYASRYIQKNRRKMQITHPDLDYDFVLQYGESYYTMPPADSLNNVLYYNTFMNGLEELLRYADINSMAHGREVRLPFLNHQLVEFVFSLPAHFKIKDGRTKWLLRAAMNDWLPAEIAWRKDKVGFEPPQKEWMQHPAMQDFVYEAKKKLAAKGIINKEALNKKIQPLDAHAADNFDWRYLAASSLF